MKRTTVNFLVDAAAFAGSLFLVVTGLLLKYRLPPGSGRLPGEHLFSPGRGKSVSLLWGLSRHQWGDVHYWIALFLLAILVFHLVLHYQWIICVIKGRKTDRSGWRLALGCTALFALLFVALLPLLTPKTTIPPTSRISKRQAAVEKLRPSRTGRRIGQRAHTENKHVRSEADHLLQIRGSLTLRDIENRYGLPKEILLRKLGLPNTIGADTRLGRLRRAYGFNMQEVRDIIKEHQK